MYAGSTTGSPTGTIGFTFRVTFDSVFSGKTYTCNGGGQNITGTVPSSLYVEITVQTLGVSYTLSCQNASGTNITKSLSTGEYYGYRNVLFLDGFETLNSNTWQQIATISQNGHAPDYWAVGDYKNVTLSGTVGIQSVSGTYRAFILGFNHNSNREGNNKTHFMIGKNSSGTNIAFCDSQYGSSGSSTAFRMNTSNTNVGGWSQSYMRNTILGATSTSATSGRFMAAIPSDLRAVLKSCTKYTDNTGNASNSSGNVTATTDYMWLCSVFEVFGEQKNANQYEQDRQEQYAYFAAGNTKVKYGAGAQSSSTDVYWWLRSPYYYISNYFCYVYTSGNANSGSANYSTGVAPCFCV